MSRYDFLIYGSYGYTGQLTVDLAIRSGIKPLLAGRNEKKLREQAHQHQLDYRVFTLDETDKLDSALQEVNTVLHCAGPFVHTFRQMAEACIRTKRHYVDISGEIPGFEALAAMDHDAKQAGIMLLPGAGFDIVPSDCLASHVSKRLPTATHFRLYVGGIGAGPSRGTAKSAIENMQRQGMIRKDGKLIQVRPAWGIREQDFGNGSVDVVTVGWGDVSTVYHSTGIPNVEVYFYFRRIVILLLKSMRVIGPLLYNRPVKRFLQMCINLFLQPGPSDEKRSKRYSLFIGEASDLNGGRAVSKLRAPEGYTLTAITAVEIMKCIMNNDLKTGFQTPSRVYGSEFIMQFDGVEREDLI